MKDELKKHIDTYVKAEVAFLNKIFAGVSQFDMVKSNNVFKDISMNSFLPSGKESLEASTEPA